MTSEDTPKWPAISVRQPWAELLISGRKSIEVRSWWPESDYRGRLWLHTGLKSAPELERRFGFRDLYLGGFIGSIELLAVVPFTAERWEQWRERHLDSGGYRSGLLAWMMGNPYRFLTPVPGKGHRRLFYPSAEELQWLKAEDRRR